GGGIRLVARTNNGLESLFHTIKHGERRRSGRKILTQDFEILPPAAALATNLHHADYVSLLCGSLDRLPEAFAALDAPHRSRSIAVGAKQSSTTVIKRDRCGASSAAKASGSRSSEPHRRPRIGLVRSLSARSKAARRWKPLR